MSGKGAPWFRAAAAAAAGGDDDDDEEDDSDYHDSGRSDDSKTSATTDDAVEEKKGKVKGGSGAGNVDDEETEDGGGKEEDSNEEAEEDEDEEEEEEEDVDSSAAAAMEDNEADVREKTLLVRDEQRQAEAIARDDKRARIVTGASLAEVDARIALFAADIATAKQAIEAKQRYLVGRDADPDAAADRLGLKALRVRLQALEANLHALQAGREYIRRLDWLHARLKGPADPEWSGGQWADHLGDVNAYREQSRSVETDAERVMGFPWRRDTLEEALTSTEISDYRSYFYGVNEFALEQARTEFIEKWAAAETRRLEAAGKRITRVQKRLVLNRDAAGCVVVEDFVWYRFPTFAHLRGIVAARVQALVGLDVRAIDNVPRGQSLGDDQVGLLEDASEREKKLALAGFDKLNARARAITREFAEVKIKPADRLAIAQLQLDAMFAIGDIRRARPPDPLSDEDRARVLRELRDVLDKLIRDFTAVVDANRAKRGGWWESNMPEYLDNMRVFHDPAANNDKMGELLDDVSERLRNRAVEDPDFPEDDADQDDIDAEIAISLLLFMVAKYTQGKNVLPSRGAPVHAEIVADTEKFIADLRSMRDTRSEAEWPAVYRARVRVLIGEILRKLFPGLRWPDAGPGRFAPDLAHELLPEAYAEQTAELARAAPGLNRGTIENVIEVWEDNVLDMKDLASATRKTGAATAAAAAAAAAGAGADGAPARKPVSKAQMKRDEAALAAANMERALQEAAAQAHGQRDADVKEAEAVRAVPVKRKNPRAPDAAVVPLAAGAGQSEKPVDGQTPGKKARQQNSASGASVRFAAAAAAVAAERSKDALVRKDAPVVESNQGAAPAAFPLPLLAPGRRSVDGQSPFKKPRSVAAETETATAPSVTSSRKRTQRALAAADAAIAGAQRVLSVSRADAAPAPVTPAQEADLVRAVQQANVAAVPVVAAAAAADATEAGDSDDELRDGEPARAASERSKRSAGRDVGDGVAVPDPTQLLPPAPEADKHAKDAPSPPPLRKQQLADDDGVDGWLRVPLDGEALADAVRRLVEEAAEKPAAAAAAPASGNGGGARVRAERITTLADSFIRRVYFACSTRVSSDETMDAWAKRTNFTREFALAATKEAPAIALERDRAPRLSKLFQPARLSVRSAWNDARTGQLSAQRFRLHVERMKMEADAQLRGLASAPAPAPSAPAPPLAPAPAPPLAPAPAPAPAVAPVPSAPAAAAAAVAVAAVAARPVVPAVAAVKRGTAESVTGSAATQDKARRYLAKHVPRSEAFNVALVARLKAYEDELRKLQSPNVYDEAKRIAHVARLASALASAVKTEFVSQGGYPEQALRVDPRTGRQNPVLPGDLKTLYARLLVVATIGRDVVDATTETIVPLQDVALAVVSNFRADLEADLQRPSATRRQPSGVFSRGTRAALDPSKRGALGQDDLAALNRVLFEDMRLRRGRDAWRYSVSLALPKPAGIVAQDLERLKQQRLNPQQQHQQQQPPPAAPQRAPPPPPSPLVRAPRPPPPPPPPPPRPPSPPPQEEQKQKQKQKKPKKAARAPSPSRPVGGAEGEDVTPPRRGADKKDRVRFPNRDRTDRGKDAQFLEVLETVLAEAGEDGALETTKRARRHVLKTLRDLRNVYASRDHPGLDATTKYYPQILEDGLATGMIDFDATEKELRFHVPREFREIIRGTIQNPDMKPYLAQTAPKEDRPLDDAERQYVLDQFQAARDRVKAEIKRDASKQLAANAKAKMRKDEVEKARLAAEAAGIAVPEKKRKKKKKKDEEEEEEAEDEE